MNLKIQSDPNKNPQIFSQNFSNWEKNVSGIESVQEQLRNLKVIESRFWRGGEIHNKGITIRTIWDWCIKSLKDEWNRANPGICGLQYANTAVYQDSGKDGCSASCCVLQRKFETNVSWQEINKRHFKAMYPLNDKRNIGTEREDCDILLNKNNNGL